MMGMPFPTVLVWTREAEKDFDRLDTPTQSRVLEALETYAETGLGDADKVRGFENVWRLRVGDWRVILERIPTTERTRILFMGHRGKVYRRLRRR